MNKTIRRIFAFALALVMMAAFLPGGIFKPVTAKAASDPIITNPDSSGWRYALLSEDNDPAGDQQNGSGSVSQDIVGDDTYASAYITFGDDGANIYVRIRVNNCDGKPASPEFKNFAFIGIDVTGNGRPDFFLGAYNPTGNSGRLGIYMAGGQSTNPKNTTLTNIASFQPVKNENFSMLRAEDGSNFGGDPDYFITFKFSIADINNALAANGVPYGFDDETPFSYIVGTGTQTNSPNSDINGKLGLGDNWDFPPPIVANPNIVVVSYDPQGGIINPAESYETLDLRDTEPLPQHVTSVPSTARPGFIF